MMALPMDDGTVGASQPGERKPDPIKNEHKCEKFTRDSVWHYKLLLDYMLNTFYRSIICTEIGTTVCFDTRHSLPFWIKFTVILHNSMILYNNQRQHYKALNAITARH